MFNGPFDGQAQSTFRQMTDDDFQCSNIDLRFVFRVHGVKMRWRMFSPEHLDDDAEKLADGWHNGALTSGG